MTLGALPEIKRVSLDIRAADALRSQICNGQIAPGTKFTEVAISTRMGLSRGTIRAALHQLCAEGLVTQTPYTAWEVASLDAHAVWELYTLRGSLEGLGARLAADTIEPKGRRMLDGALASLRKACASRDMSLVADADFALHKTIISLSGHRRLHDQYRLVESQVRMCIASSNDIVPDVASVMASHAPVIEAINDGNAELAERLSRDFSIAHGTQLRAYMLGKGSAEQSWIPQI